jgi:sigma-B regulation protein RsbU (phosphoserine phosphatase)
MKGTGTTPSDGRAPGRRRLIRLRWIVSGVAALLTAGTVVAVGGFGERNTRTALTHELRARLVLEARNLALMSAGALLSEFPELTLTPILSELQKHRGELAFSTVVDLEGAIRGHADARRIGEPHELPADLVAEADVIEAVGGERVLGNAEIIVAAAPVFRPGSRNAIGTAYVAMRREYVDGVIEAARRKQILLTAALLGAGLALVFLFLSVLLRPLGALREGLERIGRGDLETPVQLNDPTELGLLAETMNEMANRIQVAQQERVEKERLSREVELAREIQSSLLPSGYVRRGEFVIQGAHRAAAEVGGDLYDVFDLPDGRIGLTIADVSGKGLAGCLVTSMLAALLRAFRGESLSPSALMVRLENDLRDSLRPGTFITMFYGILDPKDGRLVFASAGHSPLLVVREHGGKAEWYRTMGIPIGALRGGALARSLRDEQVRLAPGDAVLQYTDGINEAFDPSGRTQFGFGRLERAVARSAAGGGAAILDAVRHDIREWVGDQSPLDDETLLVIARDAETVAESARPTGGDSGAAGETAADRRGPGRIGESGDTMVRPLTALEEARAHGYHVRLPAREEALHGLLSRFPDCPELTDLNSREIHVLESALYELCANVVEHGYGYREHETFDLWWVGSPSDAAEETDLAENPHRLRGRFVLLDHGVAFAPRRDHSVDFQEPAVRRRERGLGLEIIRVATSRAEYHPATPEGNVTIMEFDPITLNAPEEVRHGI